MIQKTLVKTLVICLLLQDAIAATADTDGRTYYRDPSWDGLYINYDSTYWKCPEESQTVSRKSHCALGCLRHLWCRSFFYVEQTGKCIFRHANFNFSTLVEDTQTLPGGVYFQVKEDTSFCPTANGYEVEPYSGICFKIPPKGIKSQADAISACAADGAHLLTLDTDVKVHAMMDLFLSRIPTWEAVHIGAARPAAEWNTAWTASSSFFQWTRTGQPLTMSHWNVPLPRNTNTKNIVIMNIRDWLRPNFCTVTAFEDCDADSWFNFICEIVN